MNKVTISGTKLITPHIGFGTSSLHHIISPYDRQLLLKEAFNNGFTHFDTSRVYGEGIGERSVGDFITKTNRNRITLATKVGLSPNTFYEKYPSMFYLKQASNIFFKAIKHPIKPTARQRSFSKYFVEKSLVDSLKALQTSWIDTLFLHEPTIEDLEEVESLGEWFYQLKKSGIVKYVGLSGYAEDCHALHKALPTMFDILQTEDSIENKEADILINNGLPLQSTYGYFRSFKKNHQNPSELKHEDYINFFKKVLDRTKSSMVLVSTTNIQHLRDLAKLAR